MTAYLRAHPVRITVPAHYTPPNFIAARYLSPQTCRELERREDAPSCAVGLFRRFTGSSPLFATHLSAVRISGVTATGREGGGQVRFVRVDGKWTVTSITYLDGGLSP